MIPMEVFVLAVIPVRRGCVLFTCHPARPLIAHNRQQQQLIMQSNNMALQHASNAQSIELQLVGGERESHGGNVERGVP